MEAGVEARTISSNGYTKVVGFAVVFSQVDFNSTVVKLCPYSLGEQYGYAEGSKFYLLAV
jgi:hypothetical protein